MFSGYIPTSSLFSMFDMEQYSDSSVVSMRVTVFDLTGNPYPIKGLSEFIVQHNPALLDSPEFKAQYAGHTGLGRVQEQIHYLNTTQQPVSFTIYVTNSYDGLPHSSILPDGTIENKDFNNLMEVSNWFESLTLPPREWRKAPMVRVSLGRYSVFGAVLNTQTQWVKMQPNGEPTIAKIDFTIKPDVLDSSQDTAFFEVT